MNRAELLAVTAAIDALTVRVVALEARVLPSPEMLAVEREVAEWSTPQEAPAKSKKAAAA